MQVLQAPGGEHHPGDPGSLPAKLFTKDGGVQAIDRGNHSAALSRGPGIPTVSGQPRRGADQHRQARRRSDENGLNLRTGEDHDIPPGVGRPRSDRGRPGERRDDSGLGAIQPGGDDFGVRHEGLLLGAGERVSSL
jgi:hypothetical protein